MFVFMKAFVHVEERSEATEQSSTRDYTYIIHI